MRTGWLDMDLARCLQLYSEQGGTLKPGAADFLKEFQGKTEDSGEKLTKQVHPSAYDHPCEWFFGTNTTQRKSLQEADAMVCGMIEGGCDCCGSLPYPPIAAEMAWPEDDGFDPRAGRNDWRFWNVPEERT